MPDDTHDRSTRSGGDALPGEKLDGTGMVAYPRAGALPTRELLDRLVDAVRVARLAQVPLSVVLADIDGFRDLHRRHGPEAAGGALDRLVTLVLEALGPGGFAGRYGDDEVCAALPVGVVDAQRMAERVRIGMASAPFTSPEGARLVVTVSVGVTSLTEGDLSELHLLRRAERAVHEAKARGRNRVVTSPGGRRRGRAY